MDYWKYILAQDYAAYIPAALGAERIDYYTLYHQLEHTFDHLDDLCLQELDVEEVMGDVIEPRVVHLIYPIGPIGADYLVSPSQQPRLLLHSDITLMMLPQSGYILIIVTPRVTDIGPLPIGSWGIAPAQVRLRSEDQFEFDCVREDYPAKAIHRLLDPSEVEQLLEEIKTLGYVQYTFEDFDYDHQLEQTYTSLLQLNRVEIC